MRVERIGGGEDWKDGCKRNGIDGIERRGVEMWLWLVGRLGGAEGFDRWRRDGV